LREGPLRRVAQFETVRNNSLDVSSEHSANPAAEAEPSHRRNPIRESNRLNPWVSISPGRFSACIRNGLLSNAAA
jgi:hypothetical protein